MAQDHQFSPYDTLIFLIRKARTLTGRNRVEALSAIDHLRSGGLVRIQDFGLKERLERI